MNSETRDMFREVAGALRAMNDTNAAQERLNTLMAKRQDAIEARIDYLAAAVRALAADPGDVADAILKVVADDDS